MLKGVAWQNGVQWQPLADEGNGGDIDEEVVESRDWSVG